MLWKAARSPQKKSGEVVEIHDVKPSLLHKYPHRVSTEHTTVLLHTAGEVARLSTAVHMSYPHVLQRFMNNFGIAFGTWHSYAVDPPCISSPARRRQNRWMPRRAPRCSGISSRAPTGRGSGRGRPMRTSRAAPRAR